MRYDPRQNKFYLKIGKQTGIKIRGKKSIFGINFLNVPASYDPDAIIIFDAMVPEPSDADKILINNFVVGCKEDENWDLIDVLWFTCAHSQQAGNLNWKNPALFTLASAGANTFTDNYGYTPDGISSYINTTWAGTDGVNFTQNNSSFGCYSLEDIDSNCSMGAVAPFFASYLYPKQGGTYYAQCNGSGGEAITGIADSKGLSVAVRTGANAQAGYFNGVEIATDGSASYTVPATAYFLGASNSQFGATAHSTFPIGFAFAGSGAINQLLLFNRVQTFLTAKGAI